MEQFQFEFSPESEQEAIEEQKKKAAQDFSEGLKETPAVPEPFEQALTESAPAENSPEPELPLPAAPETAAEPDYANFSWEQICSLYQEKTGKNPRARGFDLPTLIEGIKNPETEIERLRQIDSADDKEDIKKTYR